MRRAVLTSLAYVFVGGLLLGRVFIKMRLPGLVGMILAGVVLGPHALNLLEEPLLSQAAALRQMALLIILLRAGLALDMGDLKRVGRSALLLCFVPACFEMVGTALLAPRILGISLPEAALLGSVIAAVSPAVVVPRMLTLMQQGYGTQKRIPQMIMAGASVDDIFVIVLFTSFTTLAQGGEITPGSFLQIPASMVVGIAIGALSGVVLAWGVQRSALRETQKGILLLSTAFLLLAAEEACAGILPFSGLLAVMTVGVVLRKRAPGLAKGLSGKFAKIWVGAEILLFVLVGATVDVHYAMTAGLGALLVLLGALVFRLAGVLVCLWGTTLNLRERLFCMVAYLPKATVQAAIGGIPLAMGLPCGPLVLTVAVLSIVITAPLGAWGMDALHAWALKKEEKTA